MGKSNRSYETYDDEWGEYEPPQRKNNHKGTTAAQESQHKRKERVAREKEKQDTLEGHKIGRESGKKQRFHNL